MNYKKHVKYLLKSIRKAFEISDSLEEYEKICQCIYFSDCRLDYATFRRLKSLVL